MFVKWTTAMCIRFCMKTSFANPILSDLAGIVVSVLCQCLPAVTRMRRTSFRHPHFIAVLPPSRIAMNSLLFLPFRLSLAFTMIPPLLHSFCSCQSKLHSRGPINDTNVSFANGLDVMDISLAYLQLLNDAEWYDVLSLANTWSLRGSRLL